ncbi:diguanylate cyclase domain-containing protein [Pradoshia sp.]
MKQKLSVVLESQWKKIFLWIIALLFLFSIIQMTMLSIWIEPLQLIHWMPTFMLLLFLSALLYITMQTGDSKNPAEDMDGLISVDEIEYGVIVYDLSGKVCEINEVAQTMLNNTSKDQISWPLLNSQWEVINENGEQIQMNDWPIAIAFKEREHIKRRVMGLSHPTLKKRLWIEVSTTPVLNEDGEIEKVLLGLMDITAQKEAADRLLRKNEELKKLALTDNMLNMPNSRYFYPYLGELWEYSNKTGSPITLMFVTIDFTIKTVFVMDFLTKKNLLKDAAEILEVIDQYGGKVVKLDGNRFALISTGLFDNQVEEIERILHRELNELGALHQMTGEIDEFKIKIGTSSMVAINQTGWESLLNQAWSKLDEVRYV